MTTIIWFAFVCGVAIGFFIGFKLTGWWLLLRMRKDEHTGGDRTYKNRREKYLGKK